jgi:RimK family alpha-L-glutamate ligase
MNHTNYKIAVVTNSGSKPSLDDLKSTASKFGVTFDQIKFPFLDLNNFADSDLITKLLEYDIVYYRTGMRDTTIDELALVLKKHNIPLVNSSQTHPGVHKKIQQALLAGRHNIPHPRSFLVDKFNYDTAASLLGKVFVVKPDIGSQGSEVTIVHNADDLQAVYTNRSRDKYVFQELIEDADEYRVYTVGNTGVASYKKRVGPNDFRANLHAGGSMEPTEPERREQLHKFAGHVAQCFGADISGVDVLYKNSQCILLELNWQPGWEQLEKVSSVSFCEETLQHILNIAHSHNTKTDPQAKT